MSDSDGGRSRPRPRQVTLGGLLALTGCALTGLQHARLDGPGAVGGDARSVERVLTDPPGSGLGIDVDDRRRAAPRHGAGHRRLAAAGVVLAAYTLGRHRGARIGLSITAVLMLFTATFVSGLLPVVVAIGATMLWSRDAREWFSGRPSRPDPPAPAPSAGAVPPATGPTRTDSWRPYHRRVAAARRPAGDPGPVRPARPSSSPSSSPSASRGPRRPAALPGVRRAPGAHRPPGAGHGGGMADLGVQRHSPCCSSRMLRAAPAGRPGASCWQTLQANPQVAANGLHQPRARPSCG